MPGRVVGAVVALSGRIAPLGRYDAYQRRRGAHAALEVDRWRATGASRGGLPGALDAVRRRAEAGLGRGLAPPESALLAGMVLGQDERLSESVRTDFKRSGLAHLLAVSGQNVVLLAMLVLGAGMALGLPLRARLGAALVLVALYVPLAGGGPSIQRAGVMGAAGLVAALAGRPSSRWYALGLAAVVTLAVNPRASGEPGWQLSFAAVAGLLALVPALARGAAARAGAGAAGRRDRGHRGGDARDGAADGAALRAGLARVAAGQPGRRAGGRAGDVARDGVDRAGAGRARRCASR